MLDQAEQLRKLAQVDKQLKVDTVYNTRPVIIAVASGKGGVGKSNFVVNVSIALQKMNKKVLIFDGDMGMGNDDVLMGFLPKYNVYDIIFGDKTVEEVIIKGPFGVKLLPGGTGILKMEGITKAQREGFIEKLSLLNDLDYIVLDTGAGINRDVLGFITCCQEFIVITTPEPTSLTDAYSLVKVVNHFKLKDRAKVIVNRSIDAREGERTFNKFNSVVSKFLNMELQYLGFVSDDRKIIQAVRNQIPFLINYPQSEASRDINFIANKLAGIKEPETKVSIQGLFKKIFDIFS
ncbi:MinD/ParA family protein [Clostridium sp. WILCCON 0269]|uniref:MinD/ParA family protein n=1 Tax=Candidatus Clostridium eludens TaxID=3381663 RepID=A0ABW8SHI7_9CLOT